VTTLIVIPCSAAKADIPCEAGRMYLGALHRSAKIAAHTLATKIPDSRVVILSGLHGLLELDEVIEPYEQRIDADGAVTAEQLARQLADKGATKVVALTPSAYTHVLGDACLSLRWRTAPPLLNAPLKGAAGVGVIRARLHRIAAGMD
jgi:hypothetical protein